MTNETKYHGFMIEHAAIGLFHVPGCNCFGARTVEAAKRAIDAYRDRNGLDLNGVPYAHTYQRTPAQVGAMQDALTAVKAVWGHVQLSPEDKDAEVQRAYQLRLAALSTFDPNGGKCKSCGKSRSLRDGLCHECEQAERDAAVIVDENGEEWTPGGYAL